jgi:hypothetical protein
MKKPTMRRGVLSPSSNAWFENLEACRLMSAALPTVSVTAHQTSASEIDPTTTGMGQYMATRTGSTADALTVDYHLWSGDTAKNGVDFQAVSGVLTIAAGKSYGYVDIVPIATKTSEPQRSVKIVLDSGSYAISKDIAQVLIAAYSPASTESAGSGSAPAGEPTVSVTARLAAASEVDPTTSGVGQYMVTRTGATAKALTVDYHLWSGDTAKSGVDFEAVSGVLKIAAGRSYGYVDIVPIAHKTIDAQRSVKIVLDSGDYTISKDTAQVLIASNAPATVPPSVSIAVSDADASETDPTGSGQGTYTVTRTGSTAAALTVAYSIASSSTAVAGTNYQPLSGSVTIPAGQSSATITLTPIDDGIDDASTSVSLSLAGGSYTIDSAQNSATITIANTDVQPTISIVASDANASEADPTGSGAGTYTVTRTGPTIAASTVSYSINAASTGVAGTNFQPLSGSVTIPAGQSSATITLTPIDDGVYEGIARTVMVDLASGAYVIDAQDASATVDIANADPAPQFIETSQLPAGEPTVVKDYGVTTYFNLATESLYSSGGPLMNDVSQNSLGDCAFLATLAEIAKTDPSAITQSIQQNSDGTYDVFFDSNGQRVDIHIDAWVPVASGGNVEADEPATLLDAQLGQGGATWVAVLEKAFAVFSSGTQAPTYESITNGQSAPNIFRLFGLDTIQTYYEEGVPVPPALLTGSPDDMYGLITSALANGDAVDLATEGANQASGPLVAAHEYSVISTSTDSSGDEMITLRNPYGRGGVNGDGYITLTAAQIYQQMGELDTVVV